MSGCTDPDCVLGVGEFLDEQRASTLAVVQLRLHVQQAQAAALAAVQRAVSRGQRHSTARQRQRAVQASAVTAVDTREIYLEHTVTHQEN